MKLAPDRILRVNKSFYVTPEPGQHWCFTNVKQHEDNLGMTRPRVAPCILYKADEGSLFSMTLLQLNDSITIGSTKFPDVEKKEYKSFV